LNFLRTDFDEVYGRVTADERKTDVITVYNVS